MAIGYIELDDWLPFRKMFLLFYSHFLMLQDCQPSLQTILQHLREWYLYPQQHHEEQHLQ